MSVLSLQNLDQTLLEALRNFRRQHEGERPDYILVTKENFSIISREIIERAQANFSLTEDGMYYRGIPILDVHDGLEEDTIKLVIE